MKKQRFRELLRDEKTANNDLRKKIESSSEKDKDRFYELLNRFAGDMKDFDFAQLELKMSRDMEEQPRDTDSDWVNYIPGASEYVITIKTAR